MVFTGAWRVLGQVAGARFACGNWLPASVWAFVVGTLMSPLGSRKLSSAVIAAVVAALAVVMSPLPATASPTKPPKPPALSTKGLDKHGASSELAKALAKAQKDQKQVEVVGQRNATSTTFANPDGTLSETLSQRPTRVKKSGEWVPIDTTLTKDSKGRLAPKATTSKVTLRATASTTTSKKSSPTLMPAKPGAKPNAPAADPDPGSTDDIAVLDPPGAADISMGFGADLPAPTVKDGTASYALGGGAVLTASAMDDGFTADVVLASAPTAEPTYKFPLDLAGGLVPTLKDHTLQFSDAAGKLVAISRPLQMWDAQRDAGSDPSNVADLNAALVQTADGWELDLTAPMAYLTAASTQYPVRVDPTVTLVKADEGNTWYYDGNTTDHTASYYLPVGKKNDSGDDSQADRTYINFNTGQFVGKVVTKATLRMYQYLAGSCSPKSVEIYPTKTKSNIDSRLVQTDEDAAWSVNQSFNTGGSSCTPDQPDGYKDIDVTHIVTGWETGEFVPQYGMEIQAGSETDTAYYKRFCSETYAPSGTGHCEDADDQIPLMDITYVPDLGLQSNYETFSHKLNERNQLAINARSGDAVVKASDLHVTGRNRDLSVDRFYNSQVPDGIANAHTGSFGRGWSMSVGPDVGLLRVTPGNNDRFYYVAPGGTLYGPLVRKTESGKTDGFFEPAYGGSDVSLTEKNDTNPAIGNYYELKFRHSQEKYKFKNFTGCTDPSCDFLPMISDRDRDDNEITFSYGSTVPHRLTGIVDTEQRHFTVSTNTAGLISSITEDTSSNTPSPRTWAYGYNTANQLASYTDPVNASAVTNYTYTSTGTTGKLQLITDPAQKNGTRPKTKLTYGDPDTSRPEYATAVDFYLNDAGTSAKRYTLSYDSSFVGATTECSASDGKDWGAVTKVTNASDPQGGTTKYCYLDRDENIDPLHPGDNDPKQRIYDAKGHKRTLSFTPNNDLASGSGQGTNSETNTTAYTYDANNNIKSAIQPKDDDTNSNVQGSTSFDYNTDKTSTAGGAFLPSSAANTAGDCSKMNYDPKGHLTDTYSGLAATNVDDCDNQQPSGGKHHHVTYNDDGTPQYEFSPAVSSQYPNTKNDDIPGADKTLYTYGTAVPNAGKLIKVVRPGGNATCTTDRTLCTTYTYDGRSRVATITDGNGRTTTYTYDNDDRPTQILTNGATTCATTGGTCVQYTWDYEGNLTTRVDIKGTTTFTYDWLNRPATQTQPDGTVIATAYDGAGNLTQYKQTVPGQSADTVNYTYDGANELTTLADATGTYTYTYNDDARPTKMTMPTSSGVSVAYDYFHTGKTKSITPAGVTGLQKQTYDYGDTVNGHKQDTDKLHKITYGDTSASSPPNITYDYNHDDQLTNATPHNTTSLGAQYDYTFNDNGDLAGSTKKVGSTTTALHYGYTENDQLCWTGPTDNTGSSISRTCGTTPTGNATYTSDKQGNSLGTTTGPLHYNTQNQADQLTAPSGGSATSMSYFDQGNNLRATAGSDTFTGGTQLGVTSRRNTNGATYYTRDPYGQIINTHGAGGTYYFINNYQGSTIALVTTTGGLAGSYTYDPYGQTTTVNGTSTTAAQNNPWRYTGGYQDPTDGYYKLGARYYDAASHFTQADNIAGSLTRPEKYNSYTYTAGDPINGVDLSGLSCTSAKFEVAGEALALGIGLFTLGAIAVASDGVLAEAAITAGLFLVDSAKLGFALGAVHEEC